MLPGAARPVADLVPLDAHRVLELPDYVLPRKYTAGFGLRLLLKDVRTAVALARATGVEHLEACQPDLERDDILLLDTGWARYFRTPAYAVHPALAVSAARWLVDRGVKLLGLDLPTPDLAVPRRPPGFDWPVHKVLLSSGVLVAEHLTGLRELAGRRVEAIFGLIRIEGADGAPALVLARAARAATADTSAPRS